jgi:hypothetical protein
VGFFRFRSDWHVLADPGQIYDALADVERYPNWWPQVRSARRINDQVGELVCRSVLPYSIHLRASRVIEDRDRLQLRARLSGDLTGWSGWQIAAHGAGSIATFTEEVTTSGALRAASRLARPILEWNHAAMMRGGELGLRQYLSAETLPSDT